MALKDWKREIKSWGEIYTNKQKNQEFSIVPYGFYGNLHYDFQVKGHPELRKNFDEWSKALKFAREYMKKH